MKLLLGLTEAADSLGLYRHQIYLLLRTGRLRSIKVGKRRYIPAQEVRDFIRRETATTEPLSPLRRAIVDTLRSGPQGPTAIARAISRDRSTVWTTLQRMVTAGLVVNDAGKYSLVRGDG